MMSERNIGVFSLIAARICARVLYLVSNRIPRRLRHKEHVIALSSTRYRLLPKQCAPQSAPAFQRTSFQSS